MARDRRSFRSGAHHRPAAGPPRSQRPRSSTGRHSSRHPRGPAVLDLTPTGCHHASPHDCCPRRGGTFIPTFPSNPNTPPPNLGKPNPSIILRRNAGRTPRHKARHNLPRNSSRMAVRNPLHRGWRKGTHDPGRDTGHTTWHHPEPAPTSTNTPHHSTPEKRAGKAPGNGWEGRGASLRGRGRGRRGYSRRPPSSTAPENEPRRPTSPRPYRDWSPPRKPAPQPP